MPKLQRMKSGKKLGQHFLCIPKSLIEGMSWKKGDNIQVKISGKNKLELVRE